jgi:hypothetical protein
MNKLDVAGSRGGTAAGFCSINGSMLARGLPLPADIRWSMVSWSLDDSWVGQAERSRRVGVAQRPNALICSRQ